MLRLRTAISVIAFAAASLDAAEPILVVGPESGLTNPFGVAFDEHDRMIIAEYEGQRLWRHTPGQPLERLAADTPFDGMHNVVRTRTGDIYISDTRANYIRKLDPKSGKAVVICGTGEAGYNGDGIPAIEAMLRDPISISLSPDDQKLYIADIRGFRVRYIDLHSGLIHTAAGIGEAGVPEDGALANESPLLDPRGVAEDSKGNLYILSRRGHALRVVRPNGRIYTIAGTGKPHAANGPALQAGFKGPKHICIDNSDRVIIADAENHLIRRYDPEDETVITLLNKGPNGSPLKRPHSVWVRPNGLLYICDSYNDRILSIRL